jgi:hypothetical protein
VKIKLKEIHKNKLEQVLHAMLEDIFPEIFSVD